MELCNPLSRISNSFSRISYRSLELVNSFFRIAIRSLELDNLFSRIAIRSLEFDNSIRENGLSSSRERIAMWVTRGPTLAYILTIFDLFTSVLHSSDLRLKINDACSVI